MSSESLSRFGECIDQETTVTKERQHSKAKVIIKGRLSKQHTYTHTHSSLLLTLGTKGVG